MSSGPDIIAVPKLDDPYLRKVSGATVIRCGACRAQCWIAESSRRYLQEHPDAYVRCLPCALFMMNERRRAGEPVEFQRAEGYDEETKGTVS